MHKIKIVIIGAGVRGRYTYGEFIKNNKNICEVVAIVENKIGRRKKLQETFNLPDKKVFKDLNSFFEKDKMADAIIISSSENTHFAIYEKALKKGYDVLVEGPVAHSLDKLVHLQTICETNKDKVFMAAMSYRYSKLFNKIKDIIDKKSLGQLININYNSYIGYEKFVHYYVRGNRRLDSDTAPIFLTNSCYDLDIIEYLTNSKCKKISSFGQLNYFKRENFNLDMSELCVRCGINETCPYCAQDIYLNNSELSKGVHINPTKENVNNIIKDGQYGQCVYSCDNNVYDNVVSIIKLNNNITATLNISAFTKEEDTNIRLMFTQGEVYASLKDNIISIKSFKKNEEKIIKINNDNMDEKLIEDFLENVRERNIENIKSSVSSTINNHATAFAGEFANVSETVVDIDKFFKEAIEMTKSIEKVFL